jgi:hypothetical protein
MSWVRNPLAAPIFARSTARCRTSSTPSQSCLALQLSFQRPRRLPMYPPTPATQQSSGDLRSTLRATQLPLTPGSTPEPQAGPIPCGSPASIPHACRRSASSSTTPRGSTRSRSTTPFARCHAADARRLARGHAFRLPLQLQGAAAHHPLQPPARLRCRGRGVRRRARTGARGGQAWPAALPASAELQGRPQPTRGFPRRACVQRPASPMVAFEFRHESWFSEETYAVLRAHNAALCIAESDDLQTPEVQCARTHACYRLRRTADIARPRSRRSRRSSPRSPLSGCLRLLQARRRADRRAERGRLPRSLRRQGREAMSRAGSPLRTADQAMPIGEAIAASI